MNTFIIAFFSAGGAATLGIFFKAYFEWRNGRVADNKQLMDLFKQDAKQARLDKEEEEKKRERADARVEAETILKQKALEKAAQYKLLLIAHGIDPDSTV